MSIAFYKERVIFSDVAFILFQLILEGDWAIQIHRFVSVFTQSFGLLASKFGLPLKWVAIIHSAGFVIYYYLVFLLLLKVLKARWIALGLVLYNVLMVKESFYWIPSELIQGLAFVFIYVALIEKLIQSNTTKIWWCWTFTIFSLVTAVFSHPLTAVGITFGLLYLLLGNRKKHILLGGQLLMMIGIYCTKSTYLPNAHDTQAMSGTSKLVDYFTTYDHTPLLPFVEYLKGDYIIMVLLSFLTVVALFYQKKTLKALLVIVFTYSYSIIVNVAHLHIKEQYYIESQYLLLSVMIIIPFVKDILPTFGIRIAPD